jgi:hypothetical protein
MNDTIRMAAVFFAESTGLSWEDSYSILSGVNYGMDE